MSKLLEHLQAQKAKREEAKLQEKHAAAIAENAVKVEALRAAGPTNECKRQSGINRSVWAYLKTMVALPSVELVEEHFEEGQMQIGDETVWFGSSNWVPATIKMPYYVSLTHDVVYSAGHGRFGWGAKATGNKVMVGGYGDRKHFRQLKAGGFKYYEIAQELSHRIQGEHRKALQEQQRKNNFTAVQQVLNNVSPAHKQYSGVRIVAAPSIDKPVYVTLDWSKAMTIEAATALLNVLKQYDIG